MQKQKQKIDQRHINNMLIANAISKSSTCMDKHVGCILTDINNYILATGYNGAPRNIRHCTDAQVCAKHIGFQCLAVHAEINALINCADAHKIHSLYVTLSPCLECLKAILNTSCKYIYYNIKSVKSKNIEPFWYAVRQTSWIQIKI